jgi:hypothetical protein
MQLNGRSRDSALTVFCAAVVFCGGTNLAVAAGTQRATPTSRASGGSIVGVVLNERHEPVGRATVQAFPALATAPQAPGRQNLPPLMRASGSASTNDEGRFRISSLEPGEYLVAAEPVPLLSGELSTQAEIYAATFFPSAIDDQRAVRVSVSARLETTVQIELVRVRGVRVSGSVVNPSGRPTGGMSVRLFHRFGGFGSASNVAVVSATGRFEILRVPPGWYRLSIEPRTPDSKVAQSEFAETLIEVHDRDLDDLSLVFSRGASITGRVVTEAGARVSTGFGLLRVSASPTFDQFSAMGFIAATVGENGSFRMTVPAGRYEFAVRSDRPPFVVATRATVNGVERSLTTGVEVGDGDQEVVLSIAPRELPKPTEHTALSSGALVDQFKSEKTFWRQITTAREIVERHDRNVLPALAGWLNHEDRHVRGNVAFIFAGLGDARGFQVITEILTDRSDRPQGQGVGIASSDGRYRVGPQIAADRYYAAHLVGRPARPAGGPGSHPIADGPRGQPHCALGARRDRRQPCRRPSPCRARRCESLDPCSCDLRAGNT